MNRDALEQQLASLHADCHAWALVCCDQAHAEAEDALHSAYLRVLSGRARFDGRSSFRTWLFGVIRRTAAEEKRRWWWRRAHRNGHGAEHGIQLPRCDAAVEQHEMAVRMAGALARLPRRQREVIELVFYHEMTIAEAGAVMGVSLGSARTHYERGKKNLLRILQWKD